MKRAIIFMLILVMTITMIGCGKKADEKQGSKPEIGTVKMANLPDKKVDPNKLGTRPAIRQHKY